MGGPQRGRGGRAEARGGWGWMDGWMEGEGDGDGWTDGWKEMGVGTGGWVDGRRGGWEWVGAYAYNIRLTLRWM